MDMRIATDFHTRIHRTQACQMEEGTEKHRLYHCPEWHAVRRDIPEPFRKCEQKAKTSKKEWKWPRGTVAHLLSESQWNKGHFSVAKCESEKHRSWCMQVVALRLLVWKDWKVVNM